MSGKPGLATTKKQAATAKGKEKKVDSDAGDGTGDEMDVEPRRTNAAAAKKGRNLSQPAKSALKSVIGWYFEI